MNKMCKFAMVVGMGFALMNWAAFAQNSSAGPEHPASEVAGAPRQAASPTETVPAGIPPDQQPTKEQLAKLFELMRVREQLASVTKMMPALVQQQMQAQYQQMKKDHPEMASMTEEQQQAFGKIMGKYMERVMNLYNSDEMITDMSSLYQKHLTRSDVDGMIVFYSSPSGQHMLDMVPVIMQEFMPMVMKRMQERINPVIEQMTKEMKDVIKSSSTPIDVAPPPPPDQK